MRGTDGIAAVCVAVWLAVPLHAEGWTTLPSMPGAKHHAVGVQVAGSLYLVGGPPWANRGDADASVFRFSQGSWTTAAPIDGEGPVLGVGGGLDGLGRIVVFGGINSDNGDIASGTVYDPNQGAQGSMADRHDSAPPQRFAVARDAQGRIYSIGGGAGPQGANSGFVERYSAPTDAWQQVASVPVGLADACACSDGAGHILVFGGYNANGTARSADVWRFDVALGTWNDTLVPDMPVALTHAVAVLGNDQRIYVLGGETGAIPGGTVLSSVHVLNLIDNTWSAAPSMSVPRRDAAAALDDDDHIVIAGGTTTGGAALSSAEKLYAPTCPTFLTQSPSAHAWLGQTISLSASVGGGTPMTFQWNRDGVPLEDGPTGSGSSVSGSATPTLTVMSFGAADIGSYRLDATNGCGSTSSPAIALSLRVPPPIPAHWTVTNLHPAWAEASGATCVSHGRQGGYGIMDVAGYNNLQQPVLWEGTSGSALNITPGGSVGGAVMDMEGDTAVGSWWWPFQCYVSGQWYTCYYWQACRWTGVSSSGGIVHDQLQISGNDVGSASVVNDGVIGGSQTPEEGLPGSFGAVWTAPNFWGTALSAPNTSASFVGGVDGGDYFGSIQTPYPGPTNHAARFPNGSTSAWMDLHPAGFAASGISDADEGQQVGTTGWYNDSKAALWYGTAVSHLSLHPAGATRSGLVACMEGVQGGFATIGGIERATLWNGTAASAFDLHEFLPADFTASSLADLEVLPDGSIVAVGSAYNATAARWEAVLWTSGMDEVLGDLDGDGDVDGADLAVLLGAWGTADRAADLNADGSVNGADLAILLGAWM